MADPWMEQLAVAQHGLISRAQATAAGYSRRAIEHRVQRGMWRVVRRGVYRLVGAPETPRMWAMAAVLAVGKGAFVSHSSAAALAPLPGFELLPATVSILRGRRTYSGIRIEQSLSLPDHHVRSVDGIPCTSMARTLFDLCGDRRHVAPGRAARAVDTAIARKLVTVPALWRVLDDLAEHGRSGTVWMRTLLMERGGRYAPPESELEARFIALLDRFSIPAPERQVDLGDADHWIGRVDFVWRDKRLVVEVDGALYHDSFLDRRADNERDAQLGAAGWRVLRFRWHDVTETPDAVATTIRGKLATPWCGEVPPKRAG